MENIANTENTPEERFERCIMCGALTCIPIDMPIDWRENYEVGCGQLCSDCAEGRKENIAKEMLQTTASILRNSKK